VWESNSGAPSFISKWGDEGVECREGPPPHWGMGLERRLWGGTAYSPEKNFDFGSQIGEFWCKLGAFRTVHLTLV